MTTSTAPTTQDISERLAMLNQALNPELRPDEPVCVATINSRVKVADECFMWFVGNRIAVKRDKDTNTYHLWQ